MNEPRAGRRLLRLFPGHWRARYGDEFSTVLAQTGVSVSVAFDVLLAAADAHLHPAGTTGRWPLVILNLRRAELVIFLAWVVFAVAGSGFGWMTKDPPFMDLRDSHPTVGLAHDVVLIGAIVSAVALAAAGIPIALAIAGDALRRGRPGQLVLLAVPLIAMALWFGLTLLLAALVRPPVSDGARLTFFVVWLGAFLIAVLISAVSLGVAALNAQIDGGLYRRAVWPATFTVAGMLAVLLAVLGWGAALLASDAQVFWGPYGYLATSLPLNWLAIVLTMAGACLVALRAARRVRREASPLAG
jgi:hypothetical protein